MNYIVQIAANAILNKDATLMNGMTNTLGFIDKGIKKQTNGFADFDSLFVLFLLGKGIQTFGSAPAFSASLLYWSYNIIKDKGKRIGDDVRGKGSSFSPWKNPILYT